MKKVKPIKEELPVIKKLKYHIKKHPKHKHFIAYCYDCKEYIT